jgi:four helix bundle protein
VYSKKMALKSYQQLTVWQKAFKLALEVFHLTKLFPKEELYGLVSQMRRSAFAIPTNIAEGYMRRHRAEYIQFTSIAFSSGGELETQLLIAKETKMASNDEFTKAEKLLTEVMKMLNKLIESLEKKNE